MLKAVNQRHRTKIALEVDVLRRLRHPNIVQFLGACTRSNPVTIVSELLEGGSLADALESRPQPPLRRVLEIALDCARGLNCLHCASPHPILHRDLKPDNVMLARSHAVQVCPCGCRSNATGATSRNPCTTHASVNSNRS